MNTGLPTAKLNKLAKNCKKVREDRGLGAEEVASKLEKSIGYVYQLERGAFNPPLAILCQLKKIYRLKSLQPLLLGL